ncbi:MAG: hypothetical protein IH880_07035 [Candidatus Marinimicrobia bacterium]|nr:hypothetical protein [Candidatus Neomarinimicrobiota bacterium]
MNNSLISLLSLMIVWIPTASGSIVYRSSRSSFTDVYHSLLAERVQTASLACNTQAMICEYGFVPRNPGNEGKS